MKEDVVISVKNVRKTFYIRENQHATIRDRLLNTFNKNPLRKIEALKPVSFEVKRGEFFSILGSNGSGKTTLLNLIMGAIPPDDGGEISVNGKMIRLALGMGFNIDLTARENILVNGSILGLSLAEIDTKFDEIIEFAELEDFINTPVKFFSSGMKSRLTFAIALHAKADIFLFDEFFGGVGDIVFKNKSEKVFNKSLVDGKTIILVSHSMPTIEKNSNRALLLHYGQPILIDKPSKVIKKYQEMSAKE